jgi:hypothetical protein
VADTEYTALVMDSLGSPGLRGISGWDEMVAAKQEQGWVVEWVTVDHEKQSCASGVHYEALGAGSSQRPDAGTLSLF